MLYPLGILKYHHYPNNDFSEFIKVLDDTIKFVNISTHWRISIAIQRTENLWNKVIFKNTSELLNHFNLSDKLEIQIYIRKNQINIREITTEIRSNENKIHQGTLYETNDYQIVPITEKLYNKLPKNFGYISTHYKEKKFYTP